MDREMLNKVFDFLESEMNKDGLFYFKLEDKNQITAHFKDTGHRFAQFYINQIVKLLKEIEKEKKGD